MEKERCYKASGRGEARSIANSGRAWHSLLENRPPLTWTPDPAKSSTRRRLIASFLRCFCSRNYYLPGYYFLFPPLVHPFNSNYVFLSPPFIDPRCFFPFLSSHPN